MKQFLFEVASLFGQNEEFILIMNCVDFYHIPNIITSHNISIKQVRLYSLQYNLFSVFSYIKSCVGRNADILGTENLINRRIESCQKITKINLYNYYSR
ncbi:LOW QUALITY PROTEIN: hypothetical protein HZS_6024 [Henneguya salminicola]|nr:LOW QUALITY PROTEIN: hypothetical protein HZS_6024 [Henneguya salminicola]